MAEEARAEIDEARRKEMLKQARRARLLSFIR